MPMGEFCLGGLIIAGVTLRCALDEEGRLIAMIFVVGFERMNC